MREVRSTARGARRAHPLAADEAGLGEKSLERSQA